MEKTEWRMETTMYNPFDHPISLNGNRYTITQDAIEDFRAFFGKDIPVETIIERLAQKFPQKQSFGSEDVLKLVKESCQ